MKPTTHTYSFESEEVHEMMASTDAQTPEDALEGWARHMWPIDDGVYVLGDIEQDDYDCWTVEVIER